MSITLSIPPAIVQEARAYAESQGKSLNAMIRDYLFGITGGESRRREAARTFRELASAVSSGNRHRRGYRFNRADAYDREV